MQQRRRELEWLELNTTRSYPFDELSTRVADEQGGRLDDDLLSSLYVHVVPFDGLDVTAFYLSRVTLTPSLVYFEMSYESGDVTSLVATGSVTKSDRHAHQFFELNATDDWATTKIYGLLGRWPSFDNSQSGSFSFGIDATRLAADCVRVSTRRLASLRVRTGAQRSPIISGNVVFKADANVRFASSEIETGVRSVRVDALPPSAANASAGLYPLQVINNIGPAPDGNLNLVGLKCTEVRQQGDGILIENTCGDPCCGCDDIEPLVRQLQDGIELADQVDARLDDVNNELDQLLNQDEQLTPSCATYQMPTTTTTAAP